MYVSQLLGMIVSALVFGALLEEFTPARLIQVIQGSAVVTIALNLLALWKQETRLRGMLATPRREEPASRPPGSTSCKVPTPGAAWSPWVWARWPSACRTCCWSPMAGRCWA